jgi:hypothetical protein
LTLLGEKDKYPDHGGRARNASLKRTAFGRGPRKKLNDKMRESIPRSASKMHASSDVSVLTPIVNDKLKKMDYTQ